MAAVRVAGDAGPRTRARAARERLDWAGGLPAPVLVLILSHLDAATRARTSLVCTDWRAAADDPALWTEIDLFDGSLRRPLALAGALARAGNRLRRVGGEGDLSLDAFGSACGALAALAEKPAEANVYVRLRVGTISAARRAVAVALAATTLGLGDGVRIKLVCETPWAGETVWQVYRDERAEWPTALREVCFPVGSPPVARVYDAWQALIESGVRAPLQIAVLE